MKERCLDVNLEKSVATKLVAVKMIYGKTWWAYGKQSDSKV